jgi:hypothetical protein
MQFHLRCLAFFKRFLPSWCTQAPLIAGLEARKSVLGHWSGEVVTRSLRELKELIGHDGAHGVNPNIVTTDFAAASAIKACYRRCAARA